MYQFLERFVATNRQKLEKMAKNRVYQYIELTFNTTAILVVTMQLRMGKPSFIGNCSIIVCGTVNRATASRMRDVGWLRRRHSRRRRRCIHKLNSIQVFGVRYTYGWFVVTDSNEDGWVEVGEVYNNWIKIRPNRVFSPVLAVLAMLYNSFNLYTMGLVDISTNYYVL